MADDPALQLGPPGVDAALGGAFNTTGRSNADGLTDDWDVTRPHINPPFSSVVLDDPEMVGTWDGPNPEPEPAVNYFEELNLESLAHILRCLESKEIGVVSIVCRELNTVLMGRNGAAGFTIQCVEKKTKRPRALGGLGSLWGDPALTTLTSLALWRNQITDVTPLQHLIALTRLGLESNQITDVTPLQHLTALTTLVLDFNQITDADPTVVELKSRGVTVYL